MKIVGLATIAAWVIMAAPGAADPLPAEIALARRLFGDARAAEAAKDWSGAAAKLREAISIKETAGLRFHLAYCEEQQGMLVEALNDYERAEDLLTQPNDDFRTQLPSKKESLHKRIPTVTLVIPPEVTDASLTVDDHPVSSAFLGKAIPLNPGHHTLSVTAPNRSPFSTEVALNEADAVVTNALLLTIPKPAPVAPVANEPVVMRIDSRRAPSSSRARVYVLAGEAVVAAGMLAVGIGYTVAANSQDSRASDAFSKLGNDGSACYPQALGFPTNAATCNGLQDARSHAHDDRTVATVGFIGAGVAVAAFTGTWLLWPSHSKTAILPFAVPKAAGAFVTGWF